MFARRYAEGLVYYRHAFFGFAIIAVFGELRALMPIAQALPIAALIAIAVVLTPLEHSQSFVGKHVRNHIDANGVRARGVLTFSLFCTFLTFVATPGLQAYALWRLDNLPVAVLFYWVGIMAVFTPLGLRIIFASIRQKTST